MELDGRVAIIGVGAMGSMALWRCALRSADVVGFEALHTAADRTAVGGDTRLFRRAYQEGASYESLLELSEAFFIELNETGGESFIQCGGLSIGSRSGSYMTSLEASIEQSGAEHSVLNHEELRARHPQHKLLPDDYGIFDPRAGIIRTDQSVLKAVGRAREAGATVLQNTRIDSIIPKADHVQISAGSNRWRFQNVVLASGAWSAPLLATRLQSHLRPTRIPLTWFTAKDPSQFTPDRFPVFIRESAGASFYGAPSIDASTVKVAGMFPYTAVADPGRLLRELTGFEVERAIETVSTFLPGLYPEPVRSDAYPDLSTPNKVPIVGWVDEMPGVYVATGFSGQGFKMSPGVGEAIARDILGNQPMPGLYFARPQRFSA